MFIVNENGGNFISALSMIKFGVRNDFFFLALVLVRFLFLLMWSFPVLETMRFYLTDSTKIVMEKEKSKSLERVQHQAHCLPCVLNLSSLLY